MKTTLDIGVAPLPDALRWSENPDAGKRLKVLPGAPRRHDVKTGQHVPISPGAVPRFRADFEHDVPPVLSGGTV